MIKISVDEATAFDMLSILSLKAKNKVVLSSYITILDEIVESISLTLCNNILLSDEYAKLQASNKKVFELVDLMNSGCDISAIFVHKCNMQRYAAKKDLQNKFFNTDLTEKKI